MGKKTLPSSDVPASHKKAAFSSVDPKCGALTSAATGLRAFVTNDLRRFVVYDHVFPT
jgi:hypothetical protein